MHAPLFFSPWEMKTVRRHSRHGSSAICSKSFLLEDRTLFRVAPFEGFEMPPSFVRAVIYSNALLSAVSDSSFAKCVDSRILMLRLVDIQQSTVFWLRHCGSCRILELHLEGGLGPVELCCSDTPPPPRTEVDGYNYCLPFKSLFAGTRLWKICCQPGCSFQGLQRIWSGPKSHYVAMHCSAGCMQPDKASQNSAVGQEVLGGRRAVTSKSFPTRGSSFTALT